MSESIDTATLFNSEGEGVDVGISRYGLPLVMYQSVMKNHNIVLELDINNKQALISELNIQFCTPNELTLLLKRVENELQKINITEVLQYVMYDDWINILQSDNIFTLHFHNVNDESAIVMCSVDRCAEGIMKGLGF